MRQEMRDFFVGRVGKSESPKLTDWLFALYLRLLLFLKLPDFSNFLYLKKLSKKIRIFVNN